MAPPAAQAADDRAERAEQRLTVPVLIAALVSVPAVALAGATYLTTRYTARGASVRDAGATDVTAVE